MFRVHNTWGSCSSATLGAADVACKGTRGQQLTEEFHRSDLKGPSCSLDNLRTNQILPPPPPPVCEGKKKKKPKTIAREEPMLYITLIGKLIKTHSKKQCQSVTPVFQALLLPGCPYSYWGPSTARELSAFSLLENSSQVGKFHLWFRWAAPRVSLHGDRSA